MCKLCDNYNFGRVGYDFEARCSSGVFPTIYFSSHVGNVPEDERFKFCPMCGTPLTPEHFKNPSERG